MTGGGVTTRQYHTTTRPRSIFDNGAELNEPTMSTTNQLPQGYGAVWERKRHDGDVTVEGYHLWRGGKAILSRGVAWDTVQGL